MKLFKIFLEFFFEKKCYSCQSSGHFFCPKCREELKLYSPYCYHCKKPSNKFYIHAECQTYFPLKQVIVLTRYRNTGIPRLLKHAKYYGKYQAYKDLVDTGAKLFGENIQVGSAVFIPLPIPLLRRWKRGYNQTQKIAEYLSHHLKIPVKSNILKRTIYTKQQSQLSQSERKQNLKNTFYIRKNSLPKNTTIYLIDDIASTGSTLSQAAQTLRQSGFTNIRAIVLASD